MELGNLPFDLQRAEVVPLVVLARGVVGGLDKRLSVVTERKFIFIIEMTLDSNF